MQAGIKDAFSAHHKSWWSNSDLIEALGLGMTALGGPVEYDWNDHDRPELYSMDYRVPHYGTCTTGTDDGHVRFASDGELFAGYTGMSTNCIAPLTNIRQRFCHPPRIGWGGVDDGDSFDETARLTAVVKNKTWNGRKPILGSIKLQDPRLSGLMYAVSWGNQVRFATTQNLIWMINNVVSPRRR